MLIGIDKSMTPALLHCLARMGHGDEIVIADANFPAESIAHHCVVPEVLDLPGLDCPAAAALITSLMPLDGFTDYCALRMEIDGEPDTVGEVHQHVWDVLTPRLPDDGVLGSIERQAFYAHAKTTFAVVRTAETRPYGCFILRKGVV
ncbi:L-fucose mutarotase [Cohaesibacter sp. ES.047]|uniref:RbsD/FucU family protein n=1 Tax=Cohaesibacter sp. ES.047 TaxID=1798205 RepID=UPI000BBF8B7A|nr:RbsD/FucU domain-containing protein [Cohaesibacter sp. ES.047]SNY90229.1 L-fucose mutarotase [Cohaesibacter sp. ES.047]